MHAYLVVAVFQFAEAEGIVVVLGVRGVDGEGEGAAEVPAVRAVLVGDSVRDLIGGVFHFLGEAVGKAEFGQDGVHLRLILSGHAQDVHYMAVRSGFSALPAVYHGGYLHAFLATLRHGYGNVVGHGFGAHEHPGLLAHNVQDTHERLVAAFQHGDDFSAAALGAAHLFLGNGYPHQIPVQGPAGFGGLHVHILFLPLDAHEHKALARHQGRSHVFGYYMLLLFLAATGVPSALVAVF